VNGTAGWSGGEGLAFNGTDTYVKVPDNIMSGLSAITVSFDVQIDSGAGPPYFIYGFGNTSGHGGNGYLFTTGRHVPDLDRLRQLVDGADHPAGPARNLARGMWKHVAYTQTGTTGVLYEDGVEVARNTAVTITPGAIGGGTTTANYLGGRCTRATSYFKGRCATSGSTTGRWRGSRSSSWPSPSPPRASRRTPPPSASATPRGHRT
jgi:hypothetical protein